MICDSQTTSNDPTSKSESQPDLNLKHFHQYYLTVIPVTQLIREIGLESKLNVNVFSSLDSVLLTSKSVIDVNRIKPISKPVDQNALKEVLKARLGAYYQSPVITANSIRPDYVFSYYSNPPMCKFIRMLDSSSINYLIRVCSFFEIVDESFILQRTGPYYCDFVWNKETPLQVPKTNNAKKNSLKRPIETLDCPQPLKKTSLNCDNWCQKYIKSNQQTSVITKRKFLYGKQTNRYFNSHLETTPRHLLSRIFSSVDIELKNELSFEPLVEIMDETIKRNKRCKFKFLMNKCCHPVDLDICLDTSEAIQSSLRRSFNHNQVIAFMYSVYYYLFPRNLFGSRSNCQGIFDRLKLLVTSGSKLRFMIKNFTPQNLDLNSCSWLNDLKCNHRKKYFFDLFMIWLVDYFINLLKAHFYITESTNFKLHFYSYPVWNSIQDKFLNKLTKEKKLKPVSIEEIKQETRMDKLLLRSSNLRFIPCSNKLRVINKLRVEAGKNETRSCLQILSYFLGRLVDHSAAQRHRQNMITLKEIMNSSQESKLYFVRVDIVNCYPSIDQGKLFDLLCDKLDRKFSNASTKDPLKIKEFDLVKPFVTKLQVKKHHFSIESRTQFTELINNLSNNRKNCVVVPKRSLTKYFLQDIRALFRSYILTPYLRLGPNRYYQLIKGIRQGGNLSSGLCSLYITHVLENVVGNFGLENGEGRLIIEDDMVFISRSLERAKNCLTSMLSDFPNYGLEINTKKLQFNFSFPTNPLCQSEFFTFQGRDIHLNSKTIRYNYDKYQTENCQYFFHCNPFSPKVDIKKNLISKSIGI